MNKTILPALTAVLFAVTSVYASDKSQSELQIEAARSAVESVTVTAGAIKSAAADLQLARTYLKKAEETYAKSREWLGLMSLGDKKLEAERDVSYYTQMTDQALGLARSRMARARSNEELESLDKQITTVKGRIKVIESCRGDLDRLKGDAPRLEAASKELTALKAEKAALESKLEKLAQEQQQTEKLKGEMADQAKKLEELKADNARLTDQLARLGAETKGLAAQLDEARKSAAKAAAVVPAAPSAVK